MPKPSAPHAFHPSLLALGDVIRRARSDKGWSHEELAHQAGMDRGYMAAIERGEQNITVMSLTKIANALGISLTVLFKRAEL